jgi:transcriptional regulator with GAF, ATPase, and Fis domain
VESDPQHTLAFEHLISNLSATFVNLPAAVVDDHVKKALGQVAEFLDLDRSHVLQRDQENRVLRVTHLWIRDRRWYIPPIVPTEGYPWIIEQVLRGESVIFSHTDDLPPEASRDRKFLNRYGPLSAVVLPLVAGGSVIGGVGFGALRHKRVWAPDVVDRLRLITEIIGSALVRKRSEDELCAALAEIKELKGQLELENTYLRREIADHQRHAEIVGESKAIRDVLSQAQQVAETRSAVLLLGETGVGKELIARAIHRLSARRDRPMVKVNCAALPSTLVESELFGREKGAYTGALTRQAGRFELADQSTIFLDEVSELPLELQAKLLRVLQDGEFERLGSSTTMKTDVRVIAATNRDLASEVRAGRFREDLFYRLNVFPISIPSLRDRPEDIPLLVWTFVREFELTMGKRIQNIPRGNLDGLLAYAWPGNIRELRNVIERAMIVSTGVTLRPEVPVGGPSEPRKPGSRRLEDVERQHIRTVLEQAKWRIRGPEGAASVLGLKPTTLEGRLVKLGIKRPRIRRAER